MLRDPLRPLSEIIAASPLLCILFAVWKLPDWVGKWLDLRDRWRKTARKFR
jgi:hypothetical protein